MGKSCDFKSKQQTFYILSYRAFYFRQADRCPGKRIRQSFRCKRNIETLVRSVCRDRRRFRLFPMNRGCSISPGSAYHIAFQPVNVNIRQSRIVIKCTFYAFNAAGKGNGRQSGTIHKCPAFYDPSFGNRY